MLNTFCKKRLRHVCILDKLPVSGSDHCTVFYIMVYFMVAFPFHLSLFGSVLGQGCCFSHPTTGLIVGGIQNLTTSLIERLRDHFSHQHYIHSMYNIYKRKIKRMFKWLISIYIWTVVKLWTTSIYESIIILIKGIRIM